MNITFDPRNADDRSLVLALLGNLDAPALPEGCVQTTLADLPAVEPEKAKRTRRTKEQIANEATAKAETEVIVKPPADTVLLKKEEPEVKTIGEHLAAAQPVPTREELIGKFQGLVAKFGKDVATEKARGIITALGASNVSGIPEARRAEAVARINAELA